MSWRAKVEFRVTQAAAAAAATAADDYDGLPPQDVASSSQLAPTPLALVGDAAPRPVVTSNHETIATTSRDVATQWDSMSADIMMYLTVCRCWWAAGHRRRRGLCVDRSRRRRLTRTIIERARLGQVPVSGTCVVLIVLCCAAALTSPPLLRFS